MESVCAFHDGNVAEIDLEIILQAYTVPHRNMIINPIGRKIMRFVFFMVFFFFFFNLVLFIILVHPTTENRAGKCI